VCVALDPIHSDDGQDDVMPHTCPLLGGQKVLCRGTEELPRRGRVGGRRVRDVDQRFDPGQRPVEPRPGGDVHAPRAGHYDDFVSLPLQRLDRIPPHEAGASHDCYTHFLHSFVRSLIVDSYSVATHGPT
jgi:hypothetical protein